MTDNEFEYEDIIDDLDGLERLKWYWENQKKKASNNFTQITGLTKDDDVDFNAEENAAIDRRVKRISDNIERKKKVLSQQRYKLIISNNKEQTWNQNNNQPLLNK